MVNPTNDKVNTKTHAEDILGNENIEPEKIDRFFGLEEGSYTGCLGKTYRDETKSGKRRICVDTILISGAIGEGSNPKMVKFANVIQKDNFNQIKLVAPAGNCIVPFTFPEADSSTPSGTRFFFARMKKMFAVNLDAFKDDVVDWKRIANMAGQVITFNAVKAKNSKYVNLDVESVQKLETKISVESIKAIYDAREAEKDIPPPSDEPVLPNDLPF